MHQKSQHLLQKDAKKAHPALTSVLFPENLPESALKYTETQDRVSTLTTARHGSQQAVPMRGENHAEE